VTGEQLLAGRKKKGWSQVEAASHLGVSQPYLSLLEKGERPVSEELARKAVDFYELSAATLPVGSTLGSVQCTSEDDLTAGLAGLGYPGFSYLSHQQQRNPAELLASALSASNLDSRLTEALPWVLLNFPEMDWPWLVQTAKLHDFQNRLGFLTDVARQIAEGRGEQDKAALLVEQEMILEKSRLAREDDTLCHDSLTHAERRWLLDSRSEKARHWGLLTDLSPAHLSYAR
jgi:transcriptional regulator with XRE-family HTH domain